MKRTQLIVAIIVIAGAILLDGRARYQVVNIDKADARGAESGCPYCPTLPTLEKESELGGPFISRQR